MVKPLLSIPPLESGASDVDSKVMEVKLPLGEQIKVKKEDEKLKPILPPKGNFEKPKQKIKIDRKYLNQNEAL